MDAVNACEIKQNTLAVQGIICDNPECDFADMSVTFEEYPKWLNKPCPCCGSNLLTEADYEFCIKLNELAGILKQTRVGSEKTEARIIPLSPKMQ